MIGKTLSHYKITDKLDAGGMGEFHNGLRTMPTDSVFLLGEWLIKPDVNRISRTDRRFMDKKIFHSLRVLMPAILVFLFGMEVTFAQNVTTPEEILGFKVGADHHLATYEQAVEYFRALEKASPRMKVFDMGKTEMGRTMIYALITAEQNMAKLDRYKEISRRLALAKDLTDEEAHSLAAEGKAVVWIDVGIHASECAPAQHAIQLAYDMVTSEEPKIRLIRDNVIFLLVFANPDGMTMLADWYLPNVGTPYEMSSMPVLYNKYVGHDNNRDSYMNNMKETQNITRVVNREWFPVVLYDHHQKGPFPARIWIPPAAEPTNPNLHPLFIRGKNLIGSAMGYAFDREGKPGAISRFNYDFIYPGYEDSFCDFFNVISIMTETQFYGYATPRFYTLDDFPEAFKDFTIGVFYPNPWKGGWWTIRDAIEYDLTASKAVMHTAALYREMFLYDRYKMGRDTIAKFEKESPYAWIIPQNQWDPPVAARMLDNLIFSGIEVYEAKESFVSDGISYPEGTWVIPMNQAFSRFVKTLFEEQTYPDLLKYPALWQGIVRPQNLTDAYLPPYDMAGWTLPYQMGVKAKAANTPLTANLELLEKVVPPGGKVDGDAGYAYLLSPKTNNSFTAVNRILKEGGQVLWAKESFKAGAKEYPEGTLIALSNSVSGTFMGSLAEELSLTIDGAGSQVSAEAYRLKAPRIALYKSWRASMDEGWTRWLLEQYEFPYRNIHNPEVRAGNLRENFDVIVIPSISTDAVINGHRPGTMPPKYLGGITDGGVNNLKQFIEEGGTLIALRDGCHLAIDELKVPVKDALAGLRPVRRRSSGERQQAQAAKFACPGSVLRMEFDSKHPVAFGMPEEAPGMFQGGTAFELLSSFGGEQPVVIAKYPGGDLLMSGWLTGEQYLRNKAAAVEVPMGDGKVILLGFAVQNRAQPHGTFKLLFNSLYYGAAQ